MVYRPGAFLLFYQALLEDPINFNYLAVADESIIQDSEGNVCYDANSKVYFPKRSEFNSESESNTHSTFSVSSTRSGKKQVEN